MKRQISLLAITILFCLMLPISAYGAPAFPGTITKDTDDGKISIRLYGDENFSYVTDQDDYLLYYDDAYYYVLLEDDHYVLGEKATNESRSQYNQSNDSNRVNIENGIDNLEDKMSALNELVQSGKPAIFGLDQEEPDLIPSDYDYSNDPLSGKISEYDTSKIERPKKDSSCPLLVLKVEFNDVKCLFSDKDWHNRIFGSRDDGGGVSDYYATMSNGKFTYTPAIETYGTENDGVITVQIPIDRPLSALENEGQNCYNCLKTGIYHDADNNNYAFYNDSSFFAYGLNLADSYIDFSQYDRNGDGYISSTELAVLVEVSGYEAGYVGYEKGRPMTWAHSSISNINHLDEPDNPKSLVEGFTVITLDDKKLYKYTMMGENVSNEYDYTSQSGTKQQPQFGTACHELGHDLGLIDLYDTTYSVNIKKFVAKLSLMADGSWGYAPGGEPGSSPAALDPFSKIFLGFYDSKTISESGSYTVTDASSPENYNIYRVNTDNSNLYYLVENRTFTGYDSLFNSFSMYSTYAPGGVVFWKIDESVIEKYWNENTINSHENNYGIMPESIDEFFPLPFRNSTTSDENLLEIKSDPYTTLDCTDAGGTNMEILLNIKINPTPSDDSSNDNSDSENHSSNDDDKTSGDEQTGTNTSSDSSSTLIQASPITWIYEKANSNSLCTIEKQGPLCKKAFSAKAKSIGYSELFSFNLAIRGTDHLFHTNYNAKSGKFILYLPKKYQKPGCKMALIGLGKDGKMPVFYDSDTDDVSITINNLNIEGYAFDLIYTDSTKQGSTTASTAITQVSSGTYIVKSGDTLSKIAIKLGKTQKHLLNMNGLTNPNKLHIGQTLNY